MDRPGAPQLAGRTHTSGGPLRSLLESSRSEAPGSFGGLRVDAAVHLFSASVRAERAARSASTFSTVHPVAGRLFFSCRPIRRLHCHYHDITGPSQLPSAQLKIPLASAAAESDRSAQPCHSRQGGVKTWGRRDAAQSVKERVLSLVRSLSRSLFARKILQFLLVGSSSRTQRSGVFGLLASAPEHFPLTVSEFDRITLTDTYIIHDLYC